METLEPDAPLPGEHPDFWRVVPYNTGANIVENRAKMEVYQGERGDGALEWRWRLRAANGEIVCQGEAHSSERDAKRAAMRVLEIAGDCPDVVSV